jgi:zinc transporter ZupT
MFHAQEGEYHTTNLSMAIQQLDLTENTMDVAQLLAHDVVDLLIESANAQNNDFNFSQVSTNATAITLAEAGTVEATTATATEQNLYVLQFLPSVYATKFHLSVAEDGLYDIGLQYSASYYAPHEDEDDHDDHDDHDEEEEEHDEHDDHDDHDHDDHDDEEEEEEHALVYSENTFLIQQDGEFVASIGVEVDDHDDHDDHDDEMDLTIAQVWMWSIIGNSACAVLSLSGALLLLWKADVKEHLSNASALAIGILLGACFFSFLPEIAGHFTLDIGTSSLILGGLALGFIFKIAAHTAHEHMKSSEHNHANANTKMVSIGMKKVAKSIRQVEAEAEESTPIGDVIANLNEQGDCATIVVNGLRVHLDRIEKKKDSADVDADDVYADVENPDHDHEKTINVEHMDHFHGSQQPIMYMMGDVLCNFVDGGLITISFFNSVEAGLLATMAIVSHELPQEIAEFGVLLKCGWSVKKALIVNAAVSMSAFIGMIFAMVIHHQVEDATPYMLAFATGNFLYLAIFEMMPHVFSEDHKSHLWRHCMWIAVGLTIAGLVTLIPGHEHGAEHGDEHDDH